MARVWDDFFLFLKVTTTKKNLRALLEPPPTTETLFTTIA
jgi:hypothetical protein